MRAAVIEGPEKITVIEKPVPYPGPGEVLVKVDYCGICGSDLHAYHTGFYPHGQTIGHEFSGTVKIAGSGCETWHPGDRVTGNNNTPCGICYLCKEGLDNLCPDMLRLGIASDGAMAEYVLVPGRSLYSVSRGIPMKFAALAEPLSVALHAFRAGCCHPDQKALIIGGGTIGMIILMLLKLRGLKNIALIEPDQHRFTLADRLGAELVINPYKDKADQLLSAFTSNRGADLVFECAGLPETYAEAFNQAGAGRSVVLVGICHQTVECNYLRLMTQEIKIKPSFSKKIEDFREAVNLINTNSIDLSPLISEVIPLSRLEESFRKCDSSKVKILVDPAG